MKKIFLLSVLIFGFLQYSNGQNSVFTSPPLLGGNGGGSGGITFNLRANSTILLDSIYVALYGTANAATNVTVWYNTSPITAAPTIDAANGWVEIVASSPTTVGQSGTAITTPIFSGVSLGNLLMPTGSFWGFYVGVPSGSSGSPIYSTHTTSSIDTFSNGTITIYTGPNNGYGGSFPSPTNHPRQFNGGITYNPAAGLDAAPSTVLSPAAPILAPSSSAVTFRIINAAADPITTLTVGYQFGNNPPVIDSFSGNIPLGGFFDYTFPGLLTLPASFNNSLKVWTTNANGLGPDSNPSNDTLTVNLCSGISGTYTVGPNAADYPDLTTALDAMACGGITGPVTLQMQSGTYNGEYTISNFPGLGVYPLNITSLVNNADSVIFTSTTSSGAIFDYIGVENVNLSFITISNTVTQTAAKANVNTTGSNNLSFIGVKSIVNDVSTSSLNRNFYMLLAENITISGCYISGGYYGIYSTGPGSPNFANNNTVEFTRISEVYYYGLYFTNQFNLRVISNKIQDNRVFTSQRGIYILRGNQVAFEKNLISNFSGLYAFYCSNCTGSETIPTRVVNNVISGTFATTSSPRAIWFAGSVTDGLDYIDIMHNSIEVLSQSNATTATGIIHFTGGSTTTPAFARIRLINNSIKRENVAPTFTSSAQALVYYVNTAGLDSTISNNNNYLYNGQASSPFFRVATTTYNSISDFNTATGKEINSLNLDPLYLNDTTLEIPAASPIVGLGAAEPTVTTDINGLARNPVLPTIGAHEIMLVGCNPSVNINADSISYNGALISWITANNFHKLEYGPTGFTPGTGTIVNGLDTPTYFIDSLTPLTCYDVYVTDSCSANSISSVSGPYNFCTNKDRDLALLGFGSPEADACGDVAVPITVVVQNIGDITATNFSIQLNYSGAVNGTVTTPITANLAKNELDTFLVTTLNFSTGTTITLDAQVIYVNDLDSLNDTASITSNITNLAPPTVFAVDTAVCIGDSTILFVTNSSGNNGWFDSNNNQIGTGDSLVTSALTGTETFFARGLGITNTMVGPPDSTFGTAGVFAGGSLGAQSNLIEAFEPVKLTQAKVYPQQTGWIVMQLRTLAGVVEAEDSIFVTQTTAHDPITITVNLDIPVGQWQLGCLPNQSAGGMIRNNGGASYPYEIPGVFSIYSSTFNANSYYYFYNLQISKGGCLTDSAAITINVLPSPTADFSVTTTANQANFDASTTTNATSYDWDFGDGNTSTGATTSHTYINAGTYLVTLTASNGNCTDVFTDSVTVTALPIPDIAFIRIITPTQGAVVNQSQPVSIEITNIGTGDAVGFDVTYAVDGVSQNSNTIQTLSPGDTLIHTFTQAYVPTQGGNFELCAYTNGFDPNTVNDTACVDFSSTVNVEYLVANNFELFPNPTRGNVQINFSTNGSQQYRIECYDLAGKLISTESLGNRNGTVNHTLDLNKIAEGVYTLKLIGNDASITRKLVKIK